VFSYKSFRSDIFSPLTNPVKCDHYCKQLHRFFLIHVVIDTTALRSDPLRKSAAWKLLSRLGGAWKVQICLSCISRREFITHREEEFDTAISEARKISKKFRDLLPGDSTVDSIHLNVDDIESRRAQLGNDFDEWMTSSNAVELPVDINHTPKVIDAYFGGEPPFQQKKSRKDFPDAFIYQSVVDLKGTKDALHIITNDKKLGSKFSEIDGLLVHSSVDEFIKHAKVAPLTTRMDDLDWFMEIATGDEGVSSDQSIIDAIEVELPGQLVEGFQEEYEATIESYGDVTHLSV